MGKRRKSAYPLATQVFGLVTRQESLTPLKVIRIVLIIAGVAAVQASN